VHALLLRSVALQFNGNIKLTTHIFRRLSSVSITTITSQRLRKSNLLHVARGMNQWTSTSGVAAVPVSCFTQSTLFHFCVSCGSTRPSKSSVKIYVESMSLLSSSHCHSERRVSMEVKLAKSISETIDLIISRHQTFRTP
jgi:hypothetical protein